MIPSPESSDSTSPRPPYGTPIEVAFALFGPVSVIGFMLFRMVSSSGHSFFGLPVVMVIIAVSVPVVTAVFTLSVAAKMGVIGPKWRWGLSVAVVIVGAIGFVEFPVSNIRDIDVWRYLLWAVGGYLFLLSVPLFAEAERIDHRDFTWRFGLRVSLRCMPTALAIAVGGFFAAITHTFEYVGLLPLGFGVWTALSQWWLLSDVSSYTDRHRPLLDVGGFERLRRLTGWILVPLSVAAVIGELVWAGLWLAGRAAATNGLMWTGVVVGLLGLMGMYLAEPMVRRDKAGLMDRVWPYFPLLYAPICPVVGFVIQARISDDGWTESTYLALLLLVGLIVSGCRIVWTRYRWGDYTATESPLVFGFLLMASTVGPWGLRSVVAHSQVGRLNQRLSAADAIHLPDDYVPDPIGGRCRPETEQARLTQYIIAHLGVDVLPPTLPYDSFRQYCKSTAASNCSSCGYIDPVTPGRVDY